ncbi:hypothetical protein ACFYNO_35500 [Kitasatospora sp. NPDC006697]|uniref:hypothetical protein n=1 Tax=Kitasatospora sp. NPDC006697 TaxID=3364020 RepID=UPI00369271A5
MPASMALYANAETRIDLSTYGTERAPLLGMSGPGYSFTLGSHSHVPLADQLAFARSLAENSADFLAALELFAAANADTVPAK